MGSDNKENDKLANVGQNEVLSEEHDLDKNPIKFASHDGQLSTEAHDKDYMELTLRTGEHSDLVKRLIRQRIEQRAKEFPRWPGDMSTGVRAVWIESRFWYDRERLLPDFDNDWRLYRAKYLHSLELDPREPVRVPEYETELLNPIRRFYMKGGDFIEYKLLRKFSDDPLKTSLWRVLITRGFMGYLGFVGFYYWMRYHHLQWEAKGGPRLDVSAPIVYPGDKNYPFKNYRTEPTNHWDIGFSRRRVWNDLRDFEDTSVVL